MSAAISAASMTEAARALVDALDDAQRAKASYALADERERTRWAYFPPRWNGLPLLEMRPEQHRLTRYLLTELLSLHAFAQVQAIMALEQVLNELEGRRGAAVRDPLRYFVTFFGEPGDAAWGWRFEGHHVSIHVSVADGDVIAATPLFLGANPAVVHDGDRAVITRPCGREEDAGRALLLSLDTAQRARAIISDVAPPDFVLQNDPYISAERDVAVGDELGALPGTRETFDAYPAEAKAALRWQRAHPAGLPASAMSSNQRALLDALLRVYTGRLTPDLAAREHARIEREGIDAIHFAWAGPESPGEGHYYRLHGPDLVVEYDNTQDGANHVHAVWRSIAHDFGGDTLRRHLATEH